MALLETMQEIEERRDKTLERRQRKMARGEPVNNLPISREQLRMAMARMDQVFKENRAEEMRRQEHQERVAQAVMRMQQEEAAGQQPQQQQQVPQQPQMQQAQSGIMNQVAPMMNQGAMGGMGPTPMAQQPQQGPQAAPQNAPQAAPQNVSQGLLGMGR